MREIPILHSLYFGDYNYDSLKSVIHLNMNWSFIVIK